MWVHSGPMDKILKFLMRGDFATISSRYSDILLAGLVVAVVGMMIIPLPTHVLDILLCLNITISVAMKSQIPSFAAEYCCSGVS